MHIKVIGIVMVVAVLLSGCYKKPAPVVVAPAPVVLATLAYKAGDVRVNGTAVEIGDKINNGSSIATGQSSACEIMLGESNIITLAENTVFELDFSQALKRVRVRQGNITSVLTKLAALTDSAGLTVDTGVAALGIRGTSFFVKVEPDKAYVCVCNGSITSTDPSGLKSELLEASHHIARTYTATAEGVDVAPAGMLYHTDLDLETVAAKVGYKINWDKVE